MGAPNDIGGDDWSLSEVSWSGCSEGPLSILTTKIKIQLLFLLCCVGLAVRFQLPVWVELLINIVITIPVILLINSESLCFHGHQNVYTDQLCRALNRFLFFVRYSLYKGWKLPLIAWLESLLGKSLNLSTQKMPV